MRRGLDGRKSMFAVDPMNPLISKHKAGLDC